MLDATDASHINTNDAANLQPMGVGDILDTIFSLYRKHIIMFLGIASIYFFAGLIEYSLKGFISGKTQQTLISALAAMPFRIVSIAGIVFASAAAYLGHNITSSASIRQVFKRFFPLFGSYLIWRLVAAIVLISLSFAMVFLVRQGPLSLFLAFFGFPISIYLTVSWVLHMPIVLLEEPRVVYSFRRSSELVRGSWWQVVGILILILLITTAVEVIFEFSLAFVLILTKLAGNTELRNIIEWSIMNNILDSSSFAFYTIMTCADLIFTTLVFPIWVIGITLLYFDRRIRKEGSDIQLMTTAI